MTKGPRRHFIIPDIQARPNVHLDHCDWIGRAIVDYRPDVVINLGDTWDFPSLNAHEQPGSVPMEGQRYQDDLAAGAEAFRRLSEPMDAEIKRRRDKHRARWEPRKIFCMGNHELRADRAASNDPKFFGHIGSNNCDTRDWERHGFLSRVWVDGICYSHFFQNTHSSRPLGGEITNRLNKIGCSFVQGHEQGFRYGTRITASGATWHGIVAGSAYTHIEDYRGAQGQRHWRGVVVLNEVENGDFCIMPLTLSYLCRKYEGIGLHEYMVKKYPHQDWTHLV